MTATADNLRCCPMRARGFPRGHAYTRHPRNTTAVADVAPRVSEATPDLTMYSTTWCGYCRRLKTQLDEAGITYTVIDIEDDPVSADFVGSVNDGNHVVPTIKFRDGSTATNPSLATVKQALAALA
jgi:mycoredoxin